MRALFVFLTALSMTLVATQAARADWNVREAGAKGDSTTDDTAAFQQALDAAAAAGGGVVQVPAGVYCIRGTLQVPGAVTLQGVFHAPPQPFKNGDADLAGSVLDAYAGRGAQEGDPFIRFTGHAATLSGLLIRYPEWSQTDVPPVPYPPTVLGKGVEDVAVIDCQFLNAYEALHFQGSARMIIRNIFGYPSYRGLYINNCFDISRVENCHFWPFGVAYNPEDPYCKWVNTEGVAFEFGRTDWQYVTHTFCFGYGIGYRFSHKEKGSCNGSFVGIGADSCRRAVYVEDAQPPGLLITNGEFVGRWESKDSVGIEIAEDAKGKVNLNTCAFWGPLDMCLWARSPYAQLSVANSNFCQWDINQTDAPAVRLDAGKAIIQGNTFDEGRVHVQVNDGMISAILMGNQGQGGFRVDNHAGEKTQLATNEQPPVHWTDERKLHYLLDVGGPGDSVYLSRWFGPESASEWGEGGTRRWSTGEACLYLPVLPGKTYEVRLFMRVPQQALGEGKGLYYGDTCVIPLPDAAGETEYRGQFTADSDTAKLILRVNTWKPAENDPNSHDTRELGVAVRSVELVETTQGESKPCFNANTGE